MYAETLDEQEFMDIFAGNLKSLMEETGYNQYQLAEETGISQGAISKYLNAKQIVSMKSLYNICLVLNVNALELLPYDGCMRWK